MTKPATAASLAERKSRQLRNETRRELLDHVRHLRHSVAEAAISHNALDGSPAESVFTPGNGVQDPLSRTMDLQSCPLPKRARRETPEPVGI